MNRLGSALLTITLALPASPLLADGVDGQLPSIVRIVPKIDASTDHQSKTGAGFVVASGGGMAFVVTAAHVVQGFQEVNVIFYGDPFQPRPARPVRLDETLDVAVLQVWYVPEEVDPLPFDVTALRPGEQVFMVGFPRNSHTPLVNGGTLSGLEGSLLVVNPGVNEGNSGGPLLRNGRVVGVVRETDRSYARAVPAPAVRSALESWRVPHWLPEDPPSPPADTPEEVVSSPPPPTTGNAEYPCSGTIAFRTGAEKSFYTSPFRGSPPSGRLAEGSNITILAKQRSDGVYWYRIQTANGSQGWIEEQIVEPRGCPR